MLDKISRAWKKRAEVRKGLRGATHCQEEQSLRCRVQLPAEWAGDSSREFLKYDCHRGSGKWPPLKMSTGKRPPDLLWVGTLSLFIELRVACSVSACPYRKLLASLSFGAPASHHPLPLHSHNTGDQAQQPISTSHLPFPEVTKAGGT